MTPAKYRKEIRKRLGRGGMNLARREHGRAIFDTLGARVTRRTFTPRGVVRASRRLR